MSATVRWGVVPIGDEGGGSLRDHGRGDSVTRARDTDTTFRDGDDGTVKAAADTVDEKESVRTSPSAITVSATKGSTGTVSSEEPPTITISSE